MAFSGDDHDYCEYVHELPPSHDDPWAGHRTVKEVTVKAFSMAMGIRRPGVQLVSLLPPSYVTDHASTSISIHTIHDSPCFLPDQLGIYLSVYFPFILLSLLTLIVSNVYRVTTSPPSDNHSPPPPPPGSANLEANFDFEDWRTTTPITMDDQVPLRTVKVDKEHDVEEGFAPTTPGSAATPGTAIFGKPRSGPRPWSKSWSFVFFGRRRRMTIDSAVLGSVLSPFFSDRHQLEANIRGHRVGLIGGFVQDVGRVAWPPLLLFAVITWWAFK